MCASSNILFPYNILVISDWDFSLYANVWFHQQNFIEEVNLAPKFFLYCVVLGLTSNSLMHFLPSTEFFTILFVTIVDLM